MYAHTVDTTGPSYKTILNPYNSFLSPPSPLTHPFARISPIRAHTRTHTHALHSYSCCGNVEDKVQRSSLPLGPAPQGINSIELGSEAIAYIQRRFYEDFPAVSMYVCVYACVISVRTPSRLVNNILQGYAIPVIPTSYLISILLSTLVRSATTFSHPPQ